MGKKEQEFVKEITPMKEDFAQWYTDVVLKTDMVDYAPVKGCMVIKPYGYAVWENIQKAEDRRFKETGHENAYFPVMIPESLLRKEADHFEGFAPEVLWITKGGNEELTEKMFVRPTSETIINYMYAKWISSYRDLPVLMNQWCNVVRWEKTTRPFLRTSEFLWQEGHTCHETKEEAWEETLRMLEVYRQVAEDEIAMPVILGKKSEKEKFAGAVETTTMEAMMHDGKALQAGTSHFLGQNFSKMFDIKFQSRDGKEEYVWTTSWGTSTRLIGGLVMTHGDDRGLVMPPNIAPIQIVIIPIAQHKAGVMEASDKLFDEIKGEFRVKVDDRDNYTPGWKFNQWEMKGVPVRIEYGPRDIENGNVVLVRRDTLEKITVSRENISETLRELLKDIQQSLFNKAKKRLEDNTFSFTDYEELKNTFKEKNVFAKVMWCGCRECEDKLKADTGATIRCIPEAQEHLSDTCIFCGKPAKHMVYTAKAY